MVSIAICITHIALRGFSQVSLFLNRDPLKITVGGNTIPLAEMIGIMVALSLTSFRKAS
jgi:hypothetical protein